MSKPISRDLVEAKCKTNNLREIRKLNLWGTDISDVSLLREMVKLEVVSLSVNKIESLRDFQNCQKLEELYLRKNCIKDLAEVKYLQRLPRLRILWLSENPCSTENPNYRKIVIKMLPDLHKLDSQDVTAEERQEALQFAGGIDRSPGGGRGGGEPEFEDQRDEPRNDYMQDERQRDDHRSHPKQNNYYSKGGDDYGYGSRNKHAEHEDYASSPKKRGYKKEYRAPNPYAEPDHEPRAAPQNAAGNKRGGDAQGQKNFIQNENVVSAILALIKELNTVELDFLKREIEKKIKHLEYDYEY